MNKLNQATSSWNSGINVTIDNYLEFTDMTSSRPNASDILFDRFNILHLVTSLEGGDIYHVNYSYQRLTGRTIDDLRNDPFSWGDALDSRDQARLLELLTSTDLHATQQLDCGDFSLTHVNGETFWVRLFVTSVYDDSVGREGLTYLGIPISAQKETENKLRAQLSRMQAHALTDELTGVLNRRAVSQFALGELNRTVREGRSLSLMMIDVDRLKYVNDSFGHLEGDKILKMAATIISHSTRIYDQVGRWGGDEFMVVLPGADLAIAAQVVERIHKLMHGSVLEMDDGHEVPVRLSVGFAQFDTEKHANSPVTKEILEDLIKQADQSLYTAKQRLDI
ncbi:MAG: GGDEF domain-containing protein [Chloroflexi bacterium]|nr:MAG: GGDEF domain-containing protein [Chloroflexota bacterium]MBL1194802.1 GGDEF domain-containing protein [Chloroflexota bacterium]NOH12094.1 GGDEF domain-containing protein [Chloroflexota bacterium]